MYTVHCTGVNKTLYHAILFNLDYCRKTNFYLFIKNFLQSGVFSIETRTVNEISSDLSLKGGMNEDYNPCFPIPKACLIPLVFIIVSEA